MPQVRQLHANLGIVPVHSARAQAIRPATSGNTYVVPGVAGCNAAVTLPANAISEATIQAALSAAVTGDTIDLCPSGSPYATTGTNAGYPNGAFVVSQSSLTLQGVGATPASVVINAQPASGQGVGVVFQGSGDTLSNLTIENATDATAGAYGYGLISDGAGSALSNVVLSNNNVGASVSGTGATLSLLGVSEGTSAAQEVGLWVGPGTSATILNGGSTSPTALSDNDTAPGYGAYVQLGGSLTATNASFDGNSIGIAAPLDNKATITLTGCDVSNNSGSGVALQGAGSLTSSGTTFNNDGTAGVFVGTTNPTDGTSHLSLIGGSANGSQYGVEVELDHDEHR